MKSFIIFFSLIVTVFVYSCKSGNSDVNLDKYLDFSLQQVLQTLNSQGDIEGLPRYIKPGETGWTTTPITGWTSGFWPGILWYLYEYSGDAHIKEQAYSWTNVLNGLKEWKTKDHDLGFMVFCSYGNGYRLAGDPDFKSFILDIADTLTTLYNPNAGTILSWPGRQNIGNIHVSGAVNHNTIMDNMMNLEMLFWAAKHGDNQNLYDIAVQHARQTKRDFLRDDYSSYHVVIYDSITGEVGHKITHQGYSDDSMWARGQAWGIYGFAIAYRETGYPEFLETAKNMAHIYIKRLPEDLVPYWDFDDPRIPDVERDASAAAITASALLEIASLVEDTNESEWYRNTAINMLGSLGENYLSDGTNHAVLCHSVGNKNRNSEVGVPIIYADYYFIEALLKARRSNRLFRVYANQQ